MTPKDASRAQFGKIARFGGVGLASSALYALAVTASSSGLHIRPNTSALLAYALTIPFNFLLHRHFTFRSTGRLDGDVTRYAFAQAIGIVVSYAAMAACVDGLRLPYACGIIAAILLVPVVTYLLSDRWVFARKVEFVP